jgi:hypothetical protein
MWICGFTDLFVDLLVDMDLWIVRLITGFYTRWIYYSTWIYLWIFMVCCSWYP